MTEETKKEYKTVGEYLDEASKRDLPTDTTATEAVAAMEAAERGKLTKLVDNPPTTQGAGAPIPAADMKVYMGPKIEPGLFLFRAAVADVVSLNQYDVYVQATDPTAAEQKIHLAHKARGMTNTIYVRSIERLASSDVAGLPIRLLL